MKISIITVCYNSVKTIERTIQSVIEQFYDDIEYIIVDGGSTDGTLDIIRRYETQIAHWISERDNGVYDAMNKGIRMSTGDVIGILNSDDWYAEYSLELVADVFAKKRDLEFAYGDVMIVGESKTHREAEVRAAIEGITWYWQPSVFMRKSTYEKYGLFDTRYHYAADAAYFLHLKAKNVQAEYIPFVLTYFRLGGVSNNERYINRVTREMMHMYRELLQENVLPKDMLDGIKKCYQHAEMTYYKRLRKYIKNHFLPSEKECDFWKWILKDARKSSYVIWGAGHDGERFWKDHPTIHPFVKCFVDKHPKTVKFDNQIVSVNIPSQELLANRFIIVVTYKYHQEIKEELLKMGLREGNDFLSYTEQSFARKSASYIVKSFRKCSLNTDRNKVE